MSEIAFAGVHNFRDVGDIASLRTGLLYRSTDLSRATDADLARLAGLGIGDVFDLRTTDERAGAPDREVAGAELVAVDILADGVASWAAQLPDLVKDPAQALAALGESGHTDYMTTTYRDLVSLPSARDGYGTLFTALARPDAAPALIHCTAGKDRTGWAVAALQLILGVPLEGVYAEYLRTNDLIGPVIAPMLARFSDRGIDPDLVAPLLRVDRAFLDAAITEMTEKFGTVEDYFDAGLGIDAAGQAALRDRLG